MLDWTNVSNVDESGPPPIPDVSLVSQQTDAGTRPWVQSRLTSLSAPGLSFWKWMSREPSGLYFERHRADRQIELAASAALGGCCIPDIQAQQLASGPPRSDQQC
jgi:hypothetical protein